MRKERRKNSSIVISKSGQGTVTFFLFMMLFVTAGMIIICMDSMFKGEDIKETLVVFLVTAGVVDAVCAAMIMSFKRLSSSVMANGARLTSYSFFGKTLCTVNTKEPTYFAMFRWGESRDSGPYLIALSNKPFIYRPVCGKERVHFIWRYNMKEILILPYSERTASLLDLEKWFNVRRCEAEKLKENLWGGLRPTLNLIKPTSEEDSAGPEDEREGQQAQKREVKKIVLSKKWHNGARLYLFLIILAAFAAVGICVFGRPGKRYLFIFLAVIYELMLCGLLFGLKRRSTYAKLDGNKLTSYSFLGRSLCTLDFSHPIYFAIFEAPSVGLDVYIIALSETLFTYRTDSGKIEKNFFQYYDMEKIILLPYDDETASLLRMDKWYNVRCSIVEDQTLAWGAGLYPPAEK